MDKTDKEILLYTDGSSIGNPGSGGYGIIMELKGTTYKKEFSKRPSRLIMDNKRLIREGLNRQRNWKLSLREYLSQKYFRSLYK